MPQVPAILEFLTPIPGRCRAARARARNSPTVLTGVSRRQSCQVFTYTRETDPDGLPDRFSFVPFAFLLVSYLIPFGSIIFRRGYVIFFYPPDSVFGPN